MRYTHTLSAHPILVTLLVSCKLHRHHKQAVRSVVRTAARSAGVDIVGAVLCFLVGPLTFVQCIMSPGERYNAPHQSKVATRNFNDSSEKHMNAMLPGVGGRPRARRYHGPRGHTEDDALTDKLSLSSGSDREGDSDSSGAGLEHNRFRARYHAALNTGHPRGGIQLPPLNSPAGARQQQQVACTHPWCSSLCCFMCKHSA